MISKGVPEKVSRISAAHFRDFSKREIKLPSEGTPSICPVIGITWHCCYTLYLVKHEHQGASNCASKVCPDVFIPGSLFKGTACCWLAFSYHIPHEIRFWQANPPTLPVQLVYRPGNVLFTDWSSNTHLILYNFEFFLQLNCPVTVYVRYMALTSGPTNTWSRPLWAWPLQQPLYWFSQNWGHPSCRTGDYLLQNQRLHFLGVPQCSQHHPGWGTLSPEWLTAHPTIYSASNIMLLHCNN